MITKIERVYQLQMQKTLPALYDLSDVLYRIEMNIKHEYLPMPDEIGEQEIDDDGCVITYENDDIVLTIELPDPKRIQVMYTIQTEKAQKKFNELMLKHKKIHDDFFVLLNEIQDDITLTMELPDPKLAIVRYIAKTEKGQNFLEVVVIKQKILNNDQRLNQERDLFVWFDNKIPGNEKVNEHGLRLCDIRLMIGINKTKAPHQPYETGTMTSLIRPKRDDEDPPLLRPQMTK